MSGTISIPNPVIGIERMTTVFMYLAVESTIVFTVFAQIHRTFITTIQGSIENGLVVFTSSAYLYLAQSIVPFVSSDLSNYIYII